MHGIIVQIHVAYGAALANIWDTCSMKNTPRKLLSDSIYSKPDWAHLQSLAG